MAWFSGGDHYKNYPGSSISRPWWPAPWLRSKRGSYRRASRNRVKLRPGMVTKWNSAGFLQSKIVVLMVFLDLRSAHLVCHSLTVAWSSLKYWKQQARRYLAPLKGVLSAQKKLVKGLKPRGGSSWNRRKRKISFQAPNIKDSLIRPSD